MRVLVTGGAGYVGSHCVRALCDAGHEVTVYDNLVYGGHREAVDRRASLVVADLADEERLGRTISDGRLDGVMHFAAFLDVGESVREPLKYYRNNIANSVALLDLMRCHEVQRLVFSSTCATYGVPETVPISEDAAQRPITAYGRSKLAVEWALQDCAAAWGLGATALRYFNASGASADGDIGEDRDPEYHLIPLVLQVALEQRAHIKVFGTDYSTRDGTCVRDYVHVDDLAQAHLAALQSQPPRAFRAYNVGTGYGHTVREVIEVAREITGHAIPSIDTDRRPGDPPELFADAVRIKKELGWTPHYDGLREIIASAWRWHCSHPNGYASVDI